MKKLWIALVLVGLAALPLLAAAQSGWEIVRADYGSGNNWVDVTNQVRSLVQGNSLNFKVSSQTLGAPSQRGRNRALRLQLRDSQGNSRQNTYRDKQQVNLQVYNAYSNNGYPSNGYPGSLQINRATYGSGYRTADVTSRLNSQIQGNQLNLQVTNNNMGGDPAPNQAKTLTVQYAVNGQNNQIVVNEGDMLRLPDGNTNYGYGNNGQGSLQINRATYGSGYRTADVTSRLNSQIQGNQLNLQVTNNNMGGDPAPNQAKTLTVQYAVNGQNNQIVINEGDMLRLPDGNTNYGYGNNSQSSQIIRCESLQASGYGRNYCPANTSGGVQISRNIAGAECVQGSSWGYDSGGVWVDKGCRAEFQVLGNSQSGPTTSSTIPNGTELSVRTNEPIDSKTATVGQMFSAIIAADVVDNLGSVRIPQGSDAQLMIRSATGGGITSASDLVLDVSSVTVSGTRYLVSTANLEQKGGSGVGANKKTAIFVGGGAALGTLIGAIVGGGKGAAIGAAVGAAGGVGTEVLTKGKEVRVPSETLLTFRLDQDLNLQAMR